MLTIKNLTKSFNLETEIVTAFDNVNLNVKNGEFFTVIGPSGCGKSTLLRVIAGLDTPTHGSIEWSEKPKIGFVFQNFALLPFLTVSQNIEFGLKMTDVKKDTRQEIVQNLVEEMGLTEFKDKHPHELSGGMKQRVGIARSLAIEPNVLLMDEPFSSLDEFTAETLRDLLLNIWQKRKITIILITHLIREALELSDRIGVMSKAPGTIEKVMENKLGRPRNLRSKQFFKLEDELTEIIKK